MRQDRVRGGRVCRHAPEARLDAVEAAEPGRNADRSGAVGAEMQDARLRTAAAAAPADEPPVVTRVSQGLRVMPVSGLSPMPFQPNSGRVVLPIGTAPASSRRSTDGALSATGSVELVREPRRAGWPAQMMLSLIVSGSPSTGASGARIAQRASDRRAAVRAPSASTMLKALTTGL